MASKKMSLNLKRIAALSIALISVLALVAILLFYNQIVSFVSMPLLYVLIFFLFLLISSILMFNIPVRCMNSKKRLHGLIISKLWFYLLTSCTIGLYLISLFFDVIVLNSIFYSTIMLMVGIALSVILTKCSYRLALFCVLFLFLSYGVALYAFYPPSIGTDTSRDSNVALIISQSGHIGGITNEAYQLPVISILYALISLTLNISPAYSGALMGIVYLFLTAILAFFIANKLGNKLSTFSAYMTVILLLSIPLITIWTVWFIPEIYALMMFLLILLILLSGLHKTHDIVLVFPLLIAIILAHGGFDLWCIGFFASFIIMMHLRGAKHNSCYPFVKKVICILILVTAIYFIYTTVLGAINDGVKSVIFVFLNFARSGTTATFYTSISSISPVSTALLSYGPLVVSIVVGFIAWLGNNCDRSNFKTILLEAAFLYSLAMVAVAFLGMIYYPQAVLDRYLGLGALLLLSILASNGFRGFLKRGLAGKIFVVFLAAILITSIGFGAVLKTDFNPFNVRNSYSLVAPNSWADKASVATIASHITDGTIITDLKTSSLITNSFLNNGFSQDTAGKLDTRQGTITIISLSQLQSASYGYIESHINKGTVFIYKTGTFDASNILIGSNESQMYDALILNFNIVYSGSIEVIKR